MESLITSGEQKEFAAEIIKRRGFCRAKHISWAEPRNGLITFASKNLLKVLFLTGTNAATSYYSIHVDEVAAGAWDITYTSDLTTLYRYESSDEEEDIDLPTAVRRIFEGDENDGSEEG